MRKYFFFDIDGTLLSPIDRNALPSTIETIKALRKNGHFVSLATGRAQRLVVEIASQLGINNYVCDGGKGIVIDGKYVSYTKTDQEGMRGLVSYFKKKGMKYFVQISNDGVLYTYEELEPSLLQTIYPVFRSLDEVVLENEVIRSIYVLSHDNTDLDNAPRVEDIGYILFNYEEYNFAVFEPNVKHKGISKMIDIVGGNYNDVIVFGDGVNDIEMFKHSPFSIAMGNAVNELKSIASYVTDECDNDGIYKACKHFNWIE